MEGRPTPRIFTHRLGRRINGRTADAGRAVWAAGLAALRGAAAPAWPARRGLRASGPGRGTLAAAGRMTGAGRRGNGGPGSLHSGPEALRGHEAAHACSGPRARRVAARRARRARARRFFDLAGTRHACIYGEGVSPRRAGEGADSELAKQQNSARHATKPRRVTHSRPSMRQAMHT